MTGRVATSAPSRRFLAYLLLLGLFLTFRGYRSREVDQAYRLPILLHQQDARLYRDDPFVRAFDAFNPHRGYLGLLDGTSRVLGLSGALAVLFGLTFLATVSGLDRLGKSVWEDEDSRTGLVAASLALVTLAGNLGTNHLFEPMLLDRLIAFGLGWWAFSLAVGSAPWGAELSAAAVGVAAVVHPSLGLQIAMLLGVGRIAWRILGQSGAVTTAGTLYALGLLLVAIVPGLALNLRNSELLTRGLAPAELFLLSAELQSPQHMIPHLWRLPQWLAWFCYPVLALLALRTPRRESIPARKRLSSLLGVTLTGLFLSWLILEQTQNLRLTLFQPFRMATVARGLSLVLIAGHIRRLWGSDGLTGRLRAVLIVVGLVGDWMLVVVTLFEVTMTVGESLARKSETGARWARLFGFSVLSAGLVFLSRHDTESGHVPLLGAIVVTVVVGRMISTGLRPRTSRRAALRLAACWAVPIAALVTNLLHEEAGGAGHTLRNTLIRRCRFAEVPADDLERLAVWCRTGTPDDAVFIGPPGPKTFRLWSRRELAFNRAGSPYHARGLADWSRRFRDHVGFEGTNAAFVAAYLRNRHGLEGRYDALPNEAKAALAIRQGAGYVLASAPKTNAVDDGPLSLLKVVGRYAVYRVNRDVRVADRRPGDSPRGRRP